MSEPKNNDSQADSIEVDSIDQQPTREAIADSTAEQIEGIAEAITEVITEEDSHSDPAAELEAAQAEIIKFKDAFLRAKAEEDNIRRRSEKEMANSRKFAVEGFAKEMVNVHDSLKLACSVELGDDAEATVKNIHEGVEITLKQLDSAFGKFALVEIAPEVGEKLNPNLHQAMSLIDSEEIDSGCIINVIQAGFKLHDRLLRPAMVVVAK